VHSGGVPRLVNLICDFALVYGFSAQAPAIGRELVEEVARARGGAIAKPEQIVAETLRAH
jgi:hypothetical protein